MNEMDVPEKQLVAVDRDSFFLQMLDQKLKESPIDYLPFNNTNNVSDHLKLRQPRWLLVDYQTPADNPFTFVADLANNVLTDSTDIFIVSATILYYFEKNTEKISNCNFLCKDWILNDNNLLHLLTARDIANGDNDRFEQLIQYAA